MLGSKSRCYSKPSKTSNPLPISKKKPGGSPKKNPLKCKTVQKPFQWKVDRQKKHLPPPTLWWGGACIWKFVQINVKIFKWKIQKMVGCKMISAHHASKRLFARTHWKVGCKWLKNLEKRSLQSWSRGCWLVWGSCRQRRPRLQFCPQKLGFPLLSKSCNQQGHVHQSSSRSSGYSRVLVSCNQQRHPARYWSSGSSTRGQEAARFKCSVSNDGHRLGGFHLCQRRAKNKCSRWNGGHRVGDVDLCQGATAFKGPFSNAGHRVGDFHFCERVA